MHPRPRIAATSPHAPQCLPFGSPFRLRPSDNARDSVHEGGARTHTPSVRTSIPRPSPSPESSCRDHPPHRRMWLYSANSSLSACPSSPRTSMFNVQCSILAGIIGLGCPILATTQYDSRTLRRKRTCKRNANATTTLSLPGPQAPRLWIQEVSAS